MATFKFKSLYCSPWVFVLAVLLTNKDSRSNYFTTPDRREYTGLTGQEVRGYAGRQCGLGLGSTHNSVLGDCRHAVSQVNGPTGLTILSDVFARSDAIQPRSAVVSRSLVTRLENPHRYLIRCYSDHYILAAVADLCDCQGPEDPV